MGRRIKREGFDEDGSGSRGQTDAETLEDDNDYGSEADKGQVKAAENRGIETAA